MATWFAQNSSVNIDSVNQWNSAANGSGSWLTWASLGASDILVANGKTSITINVNVTCAQLTTSATGGTAGGGFVLADGVTVSASLVTGTTNVVTFSANAPAVAAVIGNQTATGNQFRRCILHSGSGILNVTGSLEGGSGNENVAVELSGSGVLNVTGNLGTVAAVQFGADTIRHSGTGTINITGNIASTMAAGISRSGTGAIYVTGTVTGGSAGSSGAGILSTTTALIKVIGTLTAGSLAPAVSSTGTVVVCGNQVAASNGRLAVYAPTVLIDSTLELQHAYRSDVSGSAGTARTLYTGGINLGQPITANVRSGTVFGASSEYTGTLAVPSPTLVAVGAATDNTVGSYAPTGGLDATATANAVWNSARSGHTIAGSYGATSEWAGQLGVNAPAGWINAAAIAESALNGKGDWNTVAPSNSTIASIYALLQLTDADVALIKSAMDTVSAMLPNTDFLAGAATNEGHAVLDSAALRTALGMAAADLDDQLDDILTAAQAGGGGGGAGTGARTVTITVNDGTTALQNATVRMTEGVNTFTALTNASGVAVFNLDDATYVVSISKSGYSYSGTTIVVNGTETATYSMTAIAITPGADNLTTAWLVTRVAGVATEGITIRYQQAQEPDSDTGSSYDATIYEVDSDENGVAEMPMVIGGYYYVWRGTGKRPDIAQLIEIPANAGATYELPSHVGR